MWRKSGRVTRATAGRLAPESQGSRKKEEWRGGRREEGEMVGERGEGDGSPWALNLNHPCSWGSYAESPRRPGSWKAPNNTTCPEAWEWSWSRPASRNLTLLGGKGSFLDHPFRNWPPWWNCSSPTIGGKGDPCGYYHRHRHHHHQCDAPWKSAVSRCRYPWHGVLEFEPQSGAVFRADSVPGDSSPALLGALAWPFLVWCS